MATQVVKYFMLAQNRCQSLQSWKGAKSKCLETLRAFDFFGQLKNRVEEILIDSWTIGWSDWTATKQPFLFEPFLFSSGFIQRQFLPPTNHLQAHKDRVRPTTWVKGLSRKRQIQVALVFGVNAILLLPNYLEKDNHLTNLHLGFA